MRDAIGPGEVVDRVRGEPGLLRRVGADVGEEPIVEGHDPPVAREPDADLVRLRAILAEAREALAAGLDPPHRAAPPERRGGHPDLLRVKGTPRPQRPAPVPPAHPPALHEP